MPKKKPPTRTLTPEEEKEWQRVAGFTQPLKTKKRNISQPEKAERPRRSNAPTRADRPQFKQAPPPIEKGSYAGVDKNTKARFKKGDMPIDATLDLHGYNRDEAYRKVEDFIHRHYLEGHRCLLIVTGKGALTKELFEPRHGVLRELLPAWLAEASLRPYILAFDSANQKHGGHGATYVLLRRRR